jgi:hypothetical protein
MYFFTHTIILKMFLILMQVLWLIYVASRNEPIVNRIVVDNRIDAVLEAKLGRYNVAQHRRSLPTEFRSTRNWSEGIILMDNKNDTSVGVTNAKTQSHTQNM